MRKRIGRGGGRSPFSPSSVMDRSKLIRRIQTLNLNASPDPDIVIQRLRDQYPDYARIKIRPFSARLSEVLQYIRNGNSKPLAAGNTSSSSFSDCERSSRRKRGKEDVFEERLLRAESKHLRLLQVNQVAPSSQSESSDDSTSTSDDAAFEGNIEPEFDVTKSMLRERYVKQSEQSFKKGKEEKNLEIEAIADEKRKIEIPMKKGGGSGKEAPVVGLGAIDSDHRSKIVSWETGREGPRFQDLGGLNMVLEDLMMEVIVPLCHPELPKRLGVRPTAGILLHGPPGCGKTKLAYAIANETGVPFYKISATEVISGVSGASEESIRDLFNKAYRTAPSIVFIDEIDAIASKRENLQREMERRIVTQLMTCMDESPQILRAIDSDYGPEASEKITNRMSGYVLVIGATNRPDAIDQALRRPGRFDREIALGVPDENARAEILSVLTRNLRIEGKFDRFLIARFTPGFVGADLAALVSKAGNLAMKRIIDKRRLQLKENVDWWRHPWSPEEIENLSITMLDFEEATKLVQPSTRREGFSSIPNIKWEDVGGLDSLRKAFNRYIIQRIKHPEDYEELGVDMEVGFMLYGPPGCGKTLIAKAVANEAGANFIHIKGPEILRKYVGESEEEVRTIFRRARTCSPCILFFDEVDALTPKRGREGAWVVERALNQLLIELDGADQRHGVYVIGATNRLEVIDPAILRPGRFGRLFYVPLPSADERGLILKALARKKPVSPDFDYNVFTSREACMNLSGADLAALVNEAAMTVKEEKQMYVDQGISYDEPLMIKTSHFEKALEKIIPSVSEQQRRYYEALSQNFRTA
ncbi:cell division control protein 48 homolog C [Dendrobium catenatum]|uniref:Cell division control protein 48 like C n=1 Tax=Dendrobium catenatum TaxID=906689 RepID=A0A2I0WGV0_9ASPA|nr:cell division control protein 48 homolog C [Dendrobium catenatum]PKU74869.1 Cell division control protein 48 like C [Dendrobium catenatum]